jgi:hypothetical protein
VEQASPTLSSSVSGHRNVHRPAPETSNRRHPDSPPDAGLGANFLRDPGRDHPASPDPGGTRRGPRSARATSRRVANCPSRTPSRAWSTRSTQPPISRRGCVHVEHGFSRLPGSGRLAHPRELVGDCVQPSIEADHILRPRRSSTCSQISRTSRRRCHSSSNTSRPRR